jgi:hypothetical protein
MHKNATKCNKTLNKWCKNKHRASKIMDTLETYHWNTHVTFIISFFMIFCLCSFSCYNMVAKFLLLRLYLSCPCFKFFDLSTQCLHRWSRLWWYMSPWKLFFRYHLPTRGRAEVKLGDTWYVSNVSIIFNAPCLFLHHLLYVLLHFVEFLCIFRN